VDGPSAIWLADSKATLSPVACWNDMVPLKPHCAQSLGASGKSGMAWTGAAPSKPNADIAVAAAHSGHLRRKLVSLIMDEPFWVVTAESAPPS